MIREILKEPFNILLGYIKDRKAREELMNLLVDLREAFGKEEGRSNEYFFDDSHCHFLRPKTREDLETTLEAIVNRTDRNAITTWGVSVKKTLSYGDLLELADSAYKPKEFEIKTTNDERVAFVRHKGKEAMLYPSQEIRTKSHLHITAEGCLKLIQDDLDPRETVGRIHKEGGIAIVEHPCTKQAGLIYILTNEEEDKLTRDVLEMADAAEVFNSMNSLYMPISNARAKRLVDEFNERSSRKIAAIASSDNHFGSGLGIWKHFYLRRVGRCGILLPRTDLSSLDGKDIIEMKRDYLKNGRFFRVENYTDPLMFLLEMIPPKMLRLLRIDTDSIS